MEHKFVKRVLLPNGYYFNGRGFYKNEEFIPDGWGQILYDGYFVIGNFNNGVLNGPVYENHHSYMLAYQSKGGKANGWGMRINYGKLCEFGVYENGILKYDLKNFVLQPFHAMMKDYDDSKPLLKVIDDSEHHFIDEILIGIPNQDFELGDYHASTGGNGFHFMKDRSLWVGHFLNNEVQGWLIHFRSDGKIDCGNFKNGILKDRYDISFFKDKLWDSFDYTPDIIVGHNYFTSLPTRSMLNDNSLTRVNCICSEFSVDGRMWYPLLKKKEWEIGNKFIKTAFGQLKVRSIKLIEKEDCYGLMLYTSGQLLFPDITPFKKHHNDLDNIFLWMEKNSDADRVIHVQCYNSNYSKSGPVILFTLEWDICDFKHYVSNMVEIYT